MTCPVEIPRRSFKPGDIIVPCEDSFEAVRRNYPGLDLDNHVLQHTWVVVGMAQGGLKVNVRPFGSPESSRVDQITSSSMVLANPERIAKAVKARLQAQEPNSIDRVGEQYNIYRKLGEPDNDFRTRLILSVKTGP